MPLTLLIQSELDERSATAAANRAERVYADASKNISKTMSAQIGDGARESSKAIERMADEARASYKKVGDATDELKAQERQLQQMREEGTRGVEVQAERVRQAKRREKDAIKEAATALDEYDRAAQRAADSSESAGVRAGTALRQGIRSGLDDSVSDFTRQFGTMGNVADSAFAGISRSGGLAALGVAGIGLAAVATVQQLYQLGATWDDIADGITGRTGKMGDDLDGIVNVVKQVGDTTAISLGDIGNLAGGVSQSLHLAGEPLRVITEQLASLQQVTGQVVDTKELGKAFRLFDVTDVTAQKNAINQLMNVSQATDVPINELLQTMEQSGKTTKQFGLGFAETAGLMTTFDDAGLDAEKTTSGLSIALKNLAKSGQDPATGLADTIEKIKQLHDSGQEVAAINLATSTFGKGYTDFLDAIEGGDLDVTKLHDVVRDLGGDDSIDKQKKATEDWHEEWVKLQNTLTSGFEPAASFVFSQLNGLLTGPAELLRNMSDYWTTITSTPMPAITLPTTLGADGKPVATAAPAPSTNPLLGPYGAPGTQTGGPGNPLDVFAPTTTNAPGGPALRPPGIYATNPSYAKDWYQTGNTNGKTSFDPSRYSLDSIPVQGNVPLSPMAPGSPGSQLVVDPGKVFDAETSEMSARTSVEAARVRVLELEASGTATAQDIQAAKASVQTSERAYLSAEAKLQEAQRGTWQKMEGAAKSFSNGMDQIGAGIDADFGISKGLPGIADNLVRFLGSLALAGPMAQMAATSAANPNQGFGLMGFFGSTGAFGQQYTPAAIAAANGTPGAYSAGAVAGGSPAGAALPGESARDFAHRVMMPFWQSEGLTVGDHAADKYGEHQNGALDIMVPNLAEGSKVLQQVLSDPNVYGAIFNNQTYGYGHGATPQDYSAGHTGDPSQDHTNHVHALYRPGGTNNITPGGSGPVPVTVTNGTEMMSGLTGQSDIAKAIFGAVTGAGYSPQVGMTAVQAGLLESGLSPAARNSGHNSIFQTSADKGVSDDPAAQIQWLLGEMGRQGGPAAANADPANFFADKIERGGYPGSNYGQFAGQAQNLLGGAPGGGGGGYPGLGFPQSGPGGPSLGPMLSGPELGAGPGGLGGPGSGGYTPGASPLGLPGPASPGAGAPGAPSTGVGGSVFGQTTAGGYNGANDPYGVAATNGGTSGGPSIGITPGGTIDTALNLGAAAIPGLGAAAQTGMKLASRAVQFGGQLAGIGMEGLMQTFLPAGSEKANAGWLQRGIGGIAGAKPALPNLAGKGGPPTMQPGQVPQGGAGQGQPPAQGGDTNITVNNQRATEDGTGKDIAFHLGAQNQGPGW